MNTILIASVALCVFLLFIFIDFMHNCEVVAGRKDDADGTIILKFSLLIICVMITVLRLTPEYAIGALIAIPVKLVTTYIYRVVKM